MTGLQLWWALGGAAVMAAGVGCLVVAWRRRKAQRGVAIVAGWALIAAALPAWAMAGGADRGVAMGVTALLLIALIVVGALNIQSVRGRADDGETPEAVARASGETGVIWRRVGVFMLAGPASFIAATVLGLALFVALKAPDADRLATAAYFVPLLWGVLAAWAVSDPVMPRKAAGIIGAGALGGVALAVMGAAA